MSCDDVSAHSLHALSSLCNILKQELRLVPAGSDSMTQRCLIPALLEGGHEILVVLHLKTGDPVIEMTGVSRKWESVKKSAIDGLAETMQQRHSQNGLWSVTTDDSGSIGLDYTVKFNVFEITLIQFQSFLVDCIQSMLVFEQTIKEL